MASYGIGFQVCESALPQNIRHTELKVEKQLKFKYAVWTSQKIFWITCRPSIKGSHADNDILAIFLSIMFRRLPLFNRDIGIHMRQRGHTILRSCHSLASIHHSLRSHTLLLTYLFRCALNYNAWCSHRQLLSNLNVVLSIRDIKTVRYMENNEFSCTLLLVLIQNPALELKSRSSKTMHIDWWEMNLFLSLSLATDVTCIGSAVSSICKVEYPYTCSWG